MVRVDQLTPGIYRLSQFGAEYGITFNQFLIVDDAPAIIHTGTFPMFEHVHKAVAKVIDPAKLRYVVVPHFESDECGGMDRFVEAAKNSELVCSDVGASVNLLAWDFKGPVRGMRDGTTLDLGSHRLRFWETPHVHHWDSMMVVEESTRSLFPADLFLQPGDQPSICRDNLASEMCEVYRQIGIFGSREPVLDVVNRIEEANLNWIHPMHGGSLESQTIPAYVRALHEQPFTYDGRLFGRSIRGA
jgi:flavorubredoxin